MSLNNSMPESTSESMDVGLSINPALDSSKTSDTTSTTISSSFLNTPALTEPKTLELNASLTIESSPAPFSTPKSATRQSSPSPSQEQTSNSTLNASSNNNSNSNDNNDGNGNTTTHPSIMPNATSVLDRGPLGLTADEEQWVMEKMEYALYDFQVLARAIKRYKWQLGQLPKDIDRLENLKEIHMKEPFEFLRQLKSKEFRYPENQKTLPAPTIEWSKYQFPPANPVSPTKIQSATYLNPVTFNFNSDRTNSNVISLNSRHNDNSRSRAGSPSYERLRIVKETAKNLGINTVHVHHPNLHQHHLHNHEPEPHTISDKHNDIDEPQAIEPVETPNHIPQDTNQSRFSRSLSPEVGENSNSMEGIIYSREGEQTIQHQAESRSTGQLGSSAFIPPQQSTTTFEPVNITIDHSLGHTAIQPHELGSNSNITYNHMSGSIEVQPGNPIKPRGTSREGSGVRDEPKPPLYNIPWSDEEQQLLEKLLEVYPDEPVAAQRFQKISAAIGTRTPKQVASRVQKYFIKLVKAGLVPPGRMNYSLEASKPKNKVPAATKGKKRKDAPGGQGGAGVDPAAPGKSKVGRPPKKKDPGAVVAGSKKKQKSKSLLGSGFGRTSGTQYLNYSSAPTVYMSDEDDEESVQDMLGASEVSLGKNISVINSGFHRDGSLGIATHLGYSCDSCGVEPILGIRYTCLDCIELGGTDLCGPCFNSGEYHNELHLLSHQFQSIESAEIPSYSINHRSSSVGPSGTSGIFQT